MYPPDVQCCAGVCEEDGAEPREIVFKGVKKPAKKKAPAKKKK